MEKKVSLREKQKILKAKQNELKSDKEKELDSLKDKVQKINLKTLKTKKLFFKKPKFESKLPEDIMGYIISFIKQEDMVKLNLTCKYFCKSYYDLVEKNQRHFIKNFQLPKTLSSVIFGEGFITISRLISFSIKTDFLYEVSKVSKKFTDTNQIKISGNKKEALKLTKEFLDSKEVKEGKEYLEIINEILKENSYCILREKPVGNESSTEVFCICNFNQSICFFIKIIKKEELC